MAESQSILSGERVALTKTLVGSWDGDGSYSDVTALYGSVNLEANVTSVSAQRYGDGGKLLATYNRITGGSITLEWAGDISSLGVMLGIDPATYGSSGDMIRAFRIYNRGTPYFGLVGVADLDSGEANGEHFFAPKCQINADSIPVFSVGGGEEAEFRNLSLEVIVLPDDNYVEGAVNEVQQLTLGSPTTGTYTLSLGSQTTASIAYGANAAAIDSALELLPAIGTGNVTVASGGGGFSITFNGDLASNRMPLLTGTGAGGFDGTISITRTTTGAEGYDLIMALYEVEGGYTPSLPPLFDV